MSSTAAERPTSRGGKLLRWSCLGYLGIVIVFPLTAVVVRAVSAGPARLWTEITNPFAWHAIRLSMTTAAVMVAISVVTGTATAWVLARYEFPGKGFVNALVDLPFAVPTIVTGLMLVALFGPTSTLGVVLSGFGMGIIYEQSGIVLALLFVCYPFVVRSVQPVLENLDPAEEEAAATMGASRWLIFRRVILPSLVPSIVSGAGLSFSRALGEFGSVVMVAGNRPMATKTAPLYVYGEVEGFNLEGALAVSLVLLTCSLVSLVLASKMSERQG
jgi:sulfate transport system permease protein